MPNLAFSVLDFAGPGITLKAQNVPLYISLSLVGSGKLCSCNSCISESFLKGLWNLVKPSYITPFSFLFCASLMFFYDAIKQEIRNSGASGYKYISVDEDEAACVVYANNTLLHLSMEQIPKGSAVSNIFSLNVNLY